MATTIDELRHDIAAHDAVHFLLDEEHGVASWSSTTGGLKVPTIPSTRRCRARSGGSPVRTSPGLTRCVRVESAASLPFVLLQCGRDAGG